MKSLLISLTLLFAMVFPAAASMGQNGIEIIFSQEIVALDAMGNPYQPTIIDPAAIPEMRNLDFDLQRQRTLRVVTNLQGEQENALQRVAQIVKRSYAYVEKMTGGSLDKGVLLYLVELEQLPLAYRFEASYPADAPWQEVRLVLLRKGQPLLGPAGSHELAELLYDTLPHELGHDVLADISPLLHDIDGDPSHHTRWFIEGVCELLAKQFTHHEAPESLSRFLAMRNVDEVLSDPSVRNALFSWSQQNDNSMTLESDLYGAALLLLMAWTETLELPELLGQINSCPYPLCGVDLELLMETTTGLSQVAVVERALQIGENLLHSNDLARQSVMLKPKG